MEQNWDVGRVKKYRLSTEIIYYIMVVPIMELVHCVMLQKRICINDQGGGFLMS